MLKVRKKLVKLVVFTFILLLPFFSVQAYLDVDIFYPAQNIDAIRFDFFNVTLNVSCFYENCGSINVTLDPQNWWNDSWSYRKEINITSVTTGDIYNFSVFLNVSKENSMQSDFDDLRFVSGLCSESGELLEHEIDNYTSLNAYVWVKMLNFSSGINSICMYYGNSDASQLSVASWDLNYKLVHHLQEISGTHYDSTTYGNNGTNVGNLNQNSNGVVGGADDFDGINDYVNLTPSSTIVSAEPFTISAWIKTNTAQGAYGSEGRIVNLHRLNSGSVSTAASIYAGGYSGYSTSSVCFLYATTDAGNHRWMCNETSSYHDGNWHLVSATHNGTTAKLFFDGEEIASENYGFGSMGTTTARIGSYAGGARTFNGSIDEVRISDVVRSKDWINQSYWIVKNQENLVSFGSEEEKSKGLILQTEGTIPFYTNESNPRTITLNENTSELVVFWINATGSLDSVYKFFAYINKTSDMASSNMSDSFNVTISAAYPYFSSFAASKNIAGKNDKVNFTLDVVDRTASISYVNGTISGTVYDFLFSNSDQWYYEYTCTASSNIEFTYAGANNSKGNWNETNISSVSFECDATEPSFGDSYNINESSVGVGSYFCINTTVSDANSIDKVFAEIWDTSSYLNYSMTNQTSFCGGGGDVFEAVILATSSGTWNYSAVWANDSLGNSNYSDFSDIEINVFSVNQGVNVSLIYPSGDIAPNQSRFFNVTLNVSCYVGYCGTINVTLDPASWWNSSWKKRQQIIVENTGASLDDFPIYINLTYDSDMNPDYSDLRFLSGSCEEYGGELLDFEIDNYTLFSADVWIRVPEFSTGTNLICLYYNNSGAPLIGGESAVWDLNYKLVHHLQEISGTHYDSTTYGNNGTNVGNLNQNSNGVVGGADDFDGINDYVNLTPSSTIVSAEPFTISAWIKTNTAQGAYGSEGRIVNLHRLNSGSVSTAASIYAGGYSGYSTSSVCFLYATTDAGNHRWMCNETSSYHDGNWHLVSATHNGTTAKLFFDGEEIASENYGFGSMGTTTARIGSYAGGARTFNGSIDEVRISDVVRSKDWINQSYWIVKNQENLVSFGSEEDYSTAKGKVSVNSKAVPFYTTKSSNPYTTSALNSGQSEVVVFIVNATGEVNSTYEFFAYANLTSDLNVSDQSRKFNVTIFPAPRFLVSNISTSSKVVLADNTSVDVTEIGQLGVVDVLFGLNSSKGNYSQLLEIHFSNDVNLENLTVNTSRVDVKSVSHNTSELPEQIISRALLVPRVLNTHEVYICPSATNLNEVNFSCENKVSIKTGDTKEGMTVSEVVYDGETYYKIDNISGTGGGEGNPPKLSDWNVSPYVGSEETLFIFNVTYTDDENDSASYVYVEINGVNYTMIETDTSDLDVSDGKRYYNITTLASGNLTHKYIASDEANVFNWTETLAGPEVNLYEFFVSKIEFNDSTDKENENITIFFYLNNSGVFDADNVKVNLKIEFWNGTIWIERVSESRDSVDIDANSSTIINMTWLTSQGTYNFSAFVDRTNSISEANESNNQNYSKYFVSSWVTFYGFSNETIVLGDSLSSLLQQWIPKIKSGNIYFIDEDADIDFTNLKTFTQSDDFQELDSYFNLTGFTDCISSLYDNNSDGVADLTKTFTVYGDSISNVPIINSTNNSNFYTGVLWDGNDGGSTYSGTEDTVFITEINFNKTGKYGRYDYEIQVPANLQQVITTTKKIMYFLEII